MEMGKQKANKVVNWEIRITKGYFLVFLFSEYSFIEKKNIIYVFILGFFLSQNSVSCTFWDTSHV